MKRYFKRPWNHSKGNDADRWGGCIWYYEVGNGGFPIRKIELYDNGNRLKYHAGKLFDDYGRLGDTTLDLAEWASFETDVNVFETEWNLSNPKKEHQEILDLIGAYLADHYDQRFGQALFNLNINGFVTPEDPGKSDYKVRDIHGDGDEVILKRVRERLARMEKP